MNQFKDIIIAKPMQSNTMVQISETDIINHFYQYYVNINNVDTLFVNSEIYNNYYDVTGSYKVYLDIYSNNTYNQGIIIIEVSSSKSVDLLILALIFIIFIVVKTTKSVKKYLNK